jgi:hypothetical protein
MGTRSFGRLLPVLLVALDVLLLLASGVAGQTGRAVEIRGGLWFDGRTFRPRTMYTADGRFVDRQSIVTSTVDVTGGYIVPPFGEAHNHNIGPSPDFDRLVRRYLESGVFYVQNPNNLPRDRDALAGRINVPTSIDVTFANGGFTGPGGHPAEIAARNIARHTWTPDDAEGAFFFTVHDRASVRDSWSRLQATHPDFVKVYLVYAGSYRRRLDDPATLGWRGLDPALLPTIVALAHHANQRVMVHVETASDFHVAVRAGVDVIGHIPGFRADERTELPDPTIFTLTTGDAREAARRNITVITTVADLFNYAQHSGNVEFRTRVDALLKANLRTLRDSGVSIAVGSDAYADTSVAEATYLAGTGLFTPATMLHMWSEVTPRHIFPHRRIGCFESGCEASFLVLQGNPLIDFQNTSRLILAVKQGVIVVSRQ